MVSTLYLFHGLIYRDVTGKEYCCPYINNLLCIWIYVYCSDWVSNLRTYFLDNRLLLTLFNNQDVTERRKEF
jgi:hypothetical protein